jgi:bacteriorhodopsin
MLTPTQEFWLAVGCAGMALGAGAIAFLGRRAPQGERHHFIASFTVCLLAAASYFAMANGQGILQVGDRDVFVARYIDWVITTPLLLLGLLMIALPVVTKAGEAGRERNALVAGVIGADVFMIATGIIAALTLNDTVKYAWYAISCGAFLVVLVVLWGPVRAAAAAQGTGISSLFQRLAVVLTGLWFIYPVLWLLGTEGTGTLGLTGEIAVFAVIDLSAKVGFGLLLCTGVLRLAHGHQRDEQRGSVTGTATA